MSEPRRYLDGSPSSLAFRLLRGAAEQPMPDAALARAAKRFGVATATVYLSSAAAAKAAMVPSLSAGSGTAGSTLVGTATVTFTFLKALALGLGLGATVLGTVHWVMSNEYAPNKTAFAPTSGRQPATSRPVARVSGSGPAPLKSASIYGSVEAEPRRVAAQTPPSLGSLAPQNAGSGRALPHAASSSTQVTVAHSAGEPSYREPTEPLAGIHVVPLAELPSVQASEQSLLAREVRTLDAVRAALGRGDARYALDLLDASAQLQVFQVLSRDAMVLRVDALGKVGRSREATALARQLLAKPVSPSQRRILGQWLGSE